MLRTGLRRGLQIGIRIELSGVLTIGLRAGLWT